MAESPADPPFLIIGPEDPASPVVLSVPHAGRAYSSALLRSASVPLEKLETLEDRLMDRLVWRAQSSGSTALIACAPRAEIDLNRDEREIDAAMVVPSPPSRSILHSPRTRGGLGLVPSRISGAGSIWLRRIPAREIHRRIEEIHRPYHRTLERLLQRARARFGAAILLDCHSMPPRPQPNTHAQIVFGDRYGTSITPELLQAALAAARDFGAEVACNLPYAGGYITERHGQPAAGIHALQLELDRSLYLDPALRSPGPGFDRASRLIEAIAASLAEKVLEPPQSIAAE